MGKNQKCFVSFELIFCIFEYSGNIDFYKGISNFNTKLNFRELLGSLFKFPGIKTRSNGRIWFVTKLVNL